MIRRLARLLGSVLLAVLIAALTLPYLVPLPASPDREPTSIARDLGLPGRPITVDDVRTWVVEAGPEDGPAVVLIHGFGGSTFSWRETIPDLASAGYRAIALDLPGFGLAAKSWERDTSHMAQARFITAAFDALRIDRAIVIGHSMGASVAVHLAFAAPGRVGRLVLVDGAVGSGDTGLSAVVTPIALGIPPVRRLAQHVLRRVIGPDELTRILTSAYLDPAIVTPAVRAGYLAQIATPDWDLSLLAITRDRHRNDPPASLTTLNVPTLIVWGDQDPWIPLAEGEALRDAIPGASLTVIERSGHLPFEEQPDAFIGAILPFLAATR